MVVLGGRGGGGGGRNHLNRGDGKARSVVSGRLYLSRELKRWQALLLAAAILSVPILSCSQRSLVLVTVEAPPNVTYPSSVSLVLKADDLANATETTTFDKVLFTNTVFKAGLYLPSDMSGTVMLSAVVVQDNCQVATGSVNAVGVSAGNTVSATLMLSAITCVPVVDGGAGSGGSGGSGTGGAMGTGGLTTGTGGAIGTGGVTTGA